MDDAGMRGIVNFLFEAGSLKNTPRSGWMKLGVRIPESVADHSMRTALVGWVLADMEGADADKVVKMCLVHDFAEARISDLNIVNIYYLGKNEGELKAEKDFVRSLPSGMRKEMGQLLDEWHAAKTKEARVAMDADKVEMFLQAHEYELQGYPKQALKEWKDNSDSLVKTKSGRKLMKLAGNTHYKEWWSFAKSGKKKR
ncbi:MAG: HD domain-containing protein [Candidatus Micrarchaeota archaeon]|nr:HD domain-containing protein [Candidatus Micrarchaeota archaeon]